MMAATASSMLVTKFGGVQTVPSKKPTQSPCHLTPGLACVCPAKGGPVSKPSTTAEISYVDVGMIGQPVRCSVGQSSQLGGVAGRLVVTTEIQVAGETPARDQ